MRVAIIGAGPAGLAAAYTLMKAGISAVLFEREQVVGGMSRSIDLWGQRVDLGPHRFFSRSQAVTGLWHEMAGADSRIIHRLTRILYQKHLFRYPLVFEDVVRNLGSFESARCLLSYLLPRFCSDGRKGETFESWVVANFGRRLFEIFFKSYSEKLWGLKCSEIDGDFAAQRIKKLNLFEVLRNALGLRTGHQHASLVETFSYPIGGTGMIYERMAQRFVSGGGELRLGAKIRSILRHDDGFEISDVDGKSCGAFDHIISSMPLTALLRTLPNVPSPVMRAGEQLKFRNTILVYLHLEGDGHFPDNWVYVHDPAVRTGRITNFSNWVPEIRRGSPNSIVSLEYWCNDTDPEWIAPDAPLVERASKELLATGLANGANILEGVVVRVPRCYPVYAAGYREYVSVISEYLKTLGGITAIGRYGSFKYNNQDHSILMGIIAAERLADPDRDLPDLWEINADFDRYNERVS